MTAPDHGHSRKALVSYGVAALLAMTAATAQVATGTTGIDASGSYQQEVNACLTGRTQQDQATCLREARNAQADKQRGVLDNAGAQFQANAAARCEPLTGEDRAACQARMMGYGDTSGSVAGSTTVSTSRSTPPPAGASSVTIEPKTSEPVVLVPSSR